MTAMKTNGTWQPHPWHGEWNYTITPPPRHTRTTLT
jgi:hypothetical protein